MYTLTPLERRILQVLDSTSRRWWTPGEIWEALNTDPVDRYPFNSIVSGLRALDRNELVTRDRARVYAITTLGHGLLEAAA